MLYFSTTGLLGGPVHYKENQATLIPIWFISYSLSNMSLSQLFNIIKEVTVAEFNIVDLIVIHFFYMLQQSR